ncbi:MULTISPECIES: aliphatic sulfonate ABC transporter substrate-binding protein [Methylobacterium]|jgi:sulfonate transport system substrate-binding protein|uniref:aliphatic sulfonate ABC transporter substrate-binding protein n=1 Tax=Methylobacterium TaxID=407 RepID=UPI0008E2C3E4|nr:MULTISPECIES: aliphatic sulfonate ABC transporter substrate-binding protein [Methylobacterium]MBZ6414086.1 aliphatic sulfonate ABC transporter substrate-binding protein [Methylobacterium sp.]MBK3397495.1 aliphatic sulfonate ABC transporter substrate-binding protein [Methylobacterium ajmalii]MBK3409095.1 aliphatic sulfonate ABC transporter substrate-binding protein [Methylobacterium ajmalii]MBK3424957.1 aliphatic sulfonate ABC transporter substrate-binding protein [Methylobacterium ajmalii]S
MRIHRRALIGAALGSFCLAAGAPARAQAAKEVRLDWATYNPVSLVLKDKGLLEKALAPQGITVRWVQSLGSNKALEFLNAGSIDFGSTAGAAALLARINGNPIKAVYAFSRPEWTALVTRSETGITAVKDLKGRRVAVTRGTDPHIFLIRALRGAGLTERDVKLVLLQHPDGRTALDRGDVDAWAGLDPIMAAAEIENGDVLFHRDAAANTWGVLNVREDFAKQNPDLTRTVLGAYEEARKLALADPQELKRILTAATKLPEPVVARQLERTDLSQPAIGKLQAETILDAGTALLDAGVIPAGTDVGAAVQALIDPRFGPVAP